MIFIYINRRKGDKMKTTIGVYAHVDSGKTTFCEALLYGANAISKLGRVDTASSTMDHHSIEKRRGITIFNDISYFQYKSKEYQLLDTPGHIDFISEMKQSLEVVDVAILLINGSDGVQNHSITLYKLLKKFNIPTYIFINKLDSITAELNETMMEIKNMLTEDVFYFSSSKDLYSDSYIEWLCEYDDELVIPHLEGSLSEESVRNSTERLIAQGKIHLIIGGSALKQDGIGELLELLSETILESEDTSKSDFGAYVYKILYNDKNERITLLKCTSGSLSIKDNIPIDGLMEKVHDLRVYSGSDYISKPMISAGDIVGVLGLRSSRVGSGIGIYEPKYFEAEIPTMQATLEADFPLDINFFKVLQQIEEQVPAIHFDFQSGSDLINIKFAGMIQLEIIEEILLETYGYKVAFKEFVITYMESITSPVIGFGHYEPLGHYAEVIFRMEPTDTLGLSFSSELSVDTLSVQSQNIIEASIYARTQKGVLTGSPLTKMKLVLIDGALDMIHSSSGDSRQATWRAIRQGLEKASSILLEPWYSFQIIVSTEYFGNIISDIQKRSGTFETPIIQGDQCTINGTGPVSEFMNYSDELSSLTKGKGFIQMEFLDYLPCHNAEEVIEKIGYDKDRDIEYTSSSIMFKKGAGYEVKWHEIDYE